MRSKTSKTIIALTKVLKIKMARQIKDLKNINCGLLKIKNKVVTHMTAEIIRIVCFEINLLVCIASFHFAINEYKNKIIQINN